MRRGCHGRAGHSISSTARAAGARKRKRVTTAQRCLRSRADPGLDPGDARGHITLPRRGGRTMKTFFRGLTGFIAAMFSALAFAQAPVEISFYYPVAVGGPITKIVDGLAADFEKENPGIKVKPIYSGSYQ